jgi:hypothetical protein
MVPTNWADTSSKHTLTVEAARRLARRVCCPSTGQRASCRVRERPGTSPGGRTPLLARAVRGRATVRSNRLAGPSVRVPHWGDGSDDRIKLERGRPILSKLWIRWLLATAISAVAFVGCWAGLQFGMNEPAPVALGWAVLPFSIALALSGVWADRSRREAEKSQDRMDHETGLTIQNQRAGDNARQLQVGRDLRINEKDD